MQPNLKEQFLSWFQGDTPPESLRERIVRYLELFQDIIVISLCAGLFCVMVLRLIDMFSSLLHPLEVRQITSDILFILILVELFRLLLDYLEEQRISVGAAVEITIVSSLREIILSGVLEIPTTQIFGISIFLVVLGAILVIMPWMTGLLASSHVNSHSIDTQKRM
ncbi:phosphate-starvation-inducible PsiE family protein [Calothrix sp. UHCC 0171]|uniref:phosphate-starvation-inducible PsiE family protein n=1 Tax=Calothrix sp. UHCC 0171 TaxID=3110245 RepID=UPI002B219D72|nr:phosphate-starvation-inducible PsiE family protein [Calothrix sp. UHCC 0171]MEA5570512.1 phosphate-starvation-inducible PsiE family protein [Calothrix sp. UHCC 0171]